MANMRYPADLIVSVEDFASCGWKEVLEKTSRKGYSTMWHAFSASARQAMDEDRKKHGKVLWLLADACSMMLSPESSNEPFKPFAVFHDRRSVILDDLSDSDIQFFAQIVDVVDDNWLKARLADLIWLKGKPRNQKFALQAIDAYRNLPLDTDTWVRGGRECWKRALALARMLKAKAGDRLAQMEATISAAIDASASDEGSLTLSLADLLRSNGLGRTCRPAIAAKLEALARECDGAGQIHWERDFLCAAIEWYRLIQNQFKSIELTVAVAEGWVKEAVFHASSNSPSQIMAATCYENAIQVYRSIPRSARQEYRVDERLEELGAHLNDAGERSLGEMRVIRSPSVDITKFVENARESVTGKPIREAMLAFVNLHSGAKVAELRKSAIKNIQRFPLQSVFGATTLSRDGRVIAKRPPLSMGAELTEDDEATIRAAMIRDYGILIGIIVQGDILPALEVLLLEHRLHELDFVGLARQSPVVPKERAGLFGKALFTGYERDFVTALHLLIPQIEHMVRIHLKQAGATTTNIDKHGIQNENGLSTLLDLPEADEVFGRDIAFEFRALFCDAFGPNLRNLLAHGLLDESELNSPFAIYAWWLALRIVLNAWWNTARKHGNKAPTESSHV